MFKLAMIIPSVVLYCGVRAIQKRSWWRILLWTLPSFYSLRILVNAFNMMTISIVNMHLKEDGETLVMNTMLWEGTPRKLVVKIKDIQPHN